MAYKQKIALKKWQITSSNHIHELDHMYRKLVELSGYGIYKCTWDEGRILYANKGIVDILDLTCHPKKLIGKCIKDVLYANSLKKIIKTVNRKGEIRNVEVHFKTLKGKNKWVIHNAYLVKDKETGIKHVEAVVKNITERKKAEAMLMRAKDRLAIQTWGLKKSNDAIKLLYKELEHKNKELKKTNRRLHQASIVDSHTGLFNHRYLVDIVEREYVRSSRDNRPFSIIMLDIDYFKSINDVYGHQFGDMVLRQFGKFLKKLVRRYDVVIRFGGEEFVIIAPETNANEAQLFANRILECINAYYFGTKKHVIKIRISIGISVYVEDGPVTSGMELIDAADKILRKAKEDGGNRVYSSKNLKETNNAVESHSEHVDINALRIKLEKLTKRSNQSLVEAIFALAKAIELKDHYTGEHVEQTVIYATEIAKALSLSGKDLEHIRQTSILHDLGKIGISDKILLKKGLLTKKEFNIIKKHPQIAADILRPIHVLQDVIPLILSHHEKWDGKGYPAGLKGKAIPIGARIIALADVYQALISDRPYRKAYTHQQVIGILKKAKGTHFDPQIVDAFLKIAKVNRQ